VKEVGPSGIFGNLKWANTKGSTQKAGQRQETNEGEKRKAWHAGTRSQNQAGAGQDLYGFKTGGDGPGGFKRKNAL